MAEGAAKKVKKIAGKRAQATCSGERMGPPPAQQQKRPPGRKHEMEPRPESRAAALVARGVRVNAVAPGPIWTPLIPASCPADHVSEFGGNTPMGRPGQPDEVAPACVLLAGNDSSYMTGPTLRVNGGRFVSS